MTNLAMTFADLYKEVSNYLGLGLSPAGADLELAKKYANEGYRTFLMGLDGRTGQAHAWGFLSPQAELAVWASLPAQAGLTVTGVHANGLTTLTAVGGAPFRPSMIGHAVEITEVGAFTIVGYTSATVVTVSGDATCSGATFALTGDGAYSLPEDFAAVVDDFTYAPGGPGIRLRPRSPQFLRELLASGAVAGAPQYYAIQPRALAPGAGQRYEALLWPAGGGAYSLRYRYRLEPAKLTADADLPMGGPQHAQTILTAALMTAEQRHNDLVGPHTAAFERLLAASIDLDAANKPRNLGDLAGDDRPAGAERPTAIVTYP